MLVDLGQNLGHPKISLLPWPRQARVVLRGSQRAKKMSAIQTLIMTATTKIAREQMSASIKTHRVSGLNSRVNGVSGDIWDSSQFHSACARERERAEMVIKWK